MGHEETYKEFGDMGDEEPVSISELLAQDRGRLDALLRAASPEEIRDLLRDPKIRARIEKGLAELDAGRVSESDDPE